MKLEQRSCTCQNLVLSFLGLGLKPSSIPSFGAVAQLGARLNGIQKVSGSNPLSSTKEKPAVSGFLHFRIWL